MNKYLPSNNIQGNDSDVIKKLRDEIFRHEQLLEKILAHLQLQADGWTPIFHGGTMAEPSHSFEKIRKIAAIKTKSYDGAGRLRKTWLGQLYIKHLKGNAVIRLIVHWVWRNGYPIYVNQIATRLSNAEAKRWRPLIKLNEYVKKSGISICKLAASSIVETPPPNVFPICDQCYLESPHDRYEFPEIYVAIINNAITYGGTNLILADGEVICHDLYDFKRDYTSEEFHGRTLIDQKSKCIRWLLNDEAPELVPVAATFVDACAPNYAHWMTEVFPRIMLFCAEEKFRGIPIVVNDGLHKNIMESLFLVAGADREIITLPIGRALVVSELYLISVAGYVPFERRKNKLSGHSHGIFSPHAFLKIRKYFNELDKSEINWPEKIFLRRNSGVRKVTNSVEIENLLVAHGYVIVEPEKLSFSEQVGLFLNAKTVVASSGAAIANMIFCQPASQVIIFISRQKNTSYWYWQNMAIASGGSVRYVLGETVGENKNSIHDDFYVCPDEVLKALS